MLSLLTVMTWDAFGNTASRSPPKIIGIKVSTWNRNRQKPLRRWEYIAKTSQLSPQLAPSAPLLTTPTHPDPGGPE